MPAKSDKQQTAARIAHAIKKGKVKPKKGTASAQMAKGMSDKQIKHFMVKEDDGGTTSVNIGTGSSKPPFKGAAPPFKKKKRGASNAAVAKEVGSYWAKRGGAEKKEKEEAAVQRVMNMVYAEEARLRKIT